jgi:hypothetical protein
MIDAIISVEIGLKRPFGCILAPEIERSST